MPQGTTNESILEKSYWIDAYAKENDFVFYTR